jgi:NTP pyrophosphatase (non-canonical NTP hydrolase)
MSIEKMKSVPPELIVSDSISEVQKMCGILADQKGFWDGGVEHNTPSSQLINIIGELSEAWEEIRCGREMTERYYSDSFGRITCHPVDLVSGVVNKPEGVPSELADAVIRIMDICHHYNLDLAELIAEKLRYNKTRAHRHGGKVY